MKRTVRLLSLLLAALLCLSFAACGGTAPKTTEPPADSDLAYVTGNGKLIIGYTDYAPMNYVDSDGKFTGFDTEFAIAVCEKLGLEPEFVEINWDTKEVELNAKSIDCIWNGMTINADRAANMSISLPYVKNAQVVVIKADMAGTYTDTASLIGKTVVAEIGSAGELQIKGDDENEPEENLAQAKYVGVGKQTDALVEVKAGTADACVLDWTLAKTMVGPGTDFADLVMIDGLELAAEEYGIAFRKGSDITAKVDEAIRALVADGTLLALAEKYGLSLAPSIAG